MDAVLGRPMELSALNIQGWPQKNKTGEGCRNHSLEDWAIAWWDTAIMKASLGQDTRNMSKEPRTKKIP